MFQGVTEKILMNGVVRIEIRTSGDIYAKSDTTFFVSLFK